MAIVGIVCLILSLVMIYGLTQGAIWAWVILAIIVGLIILGIISGVKKEKEIKANEIIKAEKLNEIINNYISQKEKANIPKSAKAITFYKASKDANFNLIEGRTYIWRKDSNIHFFPEEPNMANYEQHPQEINSTMLSIGSIEYFSTCGEIYRENKISGGGGGGSSVGGAIVGGVIAGGVGAVVGSRKKVQPITSTLITHDTRKTYINYFDSERNRRSLFFDYEDYQTFNDLLPEKEYHIVSSIRTNQVLQSGTKQSVIDNIKELAKLKDEGIITAEEFEAKKTELLAKM